MKKIFTMLLCVAFLFVGCIPRNLNIDTSVTTLLQQTTVATTTAQIQIQPTESDLNLTSLNDANLLHYLEDAVYNELVTTISGDKCFVEHIEAVYISKEYLQELSYNSQENIYFGYTLSELDAQFEGERYVFTLGEDGQTTVKIFEVYDDTFNRIVQNVAIGSGVILLCVTVSVISGTAGASAISMIFAASAKTGSIMALSSGVLGGAASAIVEGIQTDDWNSALTSGLLSGSESFKWGAFTGVVTGGIGKVVALKGATLNGLTMNEAAKIQKESGYPLSVIKQFHSFDEYAVFKQAGLRAEMVGGNLSLVRSDIDLYNVVDEYGRNNFTRLSNGLNPIDGSGNTFEWHHIGQKKDATLALLTATEHDAGSLHGFKVVSEINRGEFDAYKKTLNRDLLKWLLNSAE